MRLKVSQEPITNNIIVLVSDISFCCDNISKSSLMFWLNQDEADSLQFHLGAVLQDIERQKADQDHKYEQARVE